MPWFFSPKKVLILSLNEKARPKVLLYLFFLRVRRSAEKHFISMMQVYLHFCLPLITEISSTHCSFPCFDIQQTNFTGCRIAVYSSQPALLSCRSVVASFCLHAGFYRERPWTIANDHELPWLIVNDHEQPWTTVNEKSFSIKSFTGIHRKKNIFQEQPWTTAMFNELSFWERVFVCDNMNVSDTMQFIDSMHFTDNMRRIVNIY